MSKRPVRNMADYRQWSAKKQCRSSWPNSPDTQRMQATSRAYATRDGAMTSAANLQAYAESKLRYEEQQNMAYVRSVLSKLSTNGRD